MHILPLQQVSITRAGHGPNKHSPQLSNSFGNSFSLIFSYFIWMLYFKPSSSTNEVINRLEHSFYKTIPPGCLDSFQLTFWNNNKNNVFTCTPLVFIHQLWLFVKIFYMQFLLRDFALQSIQKALLRLSLFHFCEDFIVRHGQYIFS